MPRLGTSQEQALLPAGVQRTRGVVDVAPPSGHRVVANDNDLAPFRRPARGLHRVEAAYPDLPAAAGFALGLLAAASRTGGDGGDAAVLWAFTIRAEREW